ncbi:MAG: TrmH family RNA methyltransferase, partial [Microthrixaceae bacterium]
MEQLEDPGDPRLADYRHLTDAAARRHLEGGDGHGIFVVEGVLALEQLLRSDHPVRSVLLSTSRAASSDELVGRLEARGVPVLVAARPVLAQVTGYDVHRGVLAVAERRPWPGLADTLCAARRVVVLEGLNDHENLGSVYRNAAAFGLDAVLLDPRCADPLYRRSIRVSSGWALRVPSARTAALPDGLNALQDAGFRTLALTPAADASAVDHAAATGLLDDRVAFVLGAEGPGLTAETLAACDHRVAVPMQ